MKIENFVYFNSHYLYMVCFLGKNCCCCRPLYEYTTILKAIFFWEYAGCVWWSYEQNSQYTTIIDLFLFSIQLILFQTKTLYYQSSLEEKLLIFCCCCLSILSFENFYGQIFIHPSIEREKKRKIFVFFRDPNFLWPWPS